MKMAKNDLKEATKAATAGMFTLNTDRENAESIKPHIEIRTENEENNIHDKKKKAAKGKKPANDYLYLDLRPAGGEDLKSYVVERAHRTSMEQGKNISATNYIQNLIKKDMVSEKDNTLKAKITAIIDNADEKKLDVIYTIIKNII